MISQQIGLQYGLVRLSPVTLGFGHVSVCRFLTVNHPAPRNECTTVQVSVAPASLHKFICKQVKIYESLSRLTVKDRVVSCQAGGKTLWQGFHIGAGCCGSAC